MRIRPSLLSLLFLLSVVPVILVIPTARAAPIAEAEPNDTAAQAQALAQIGLDSAVNASIDVAGDVDWYSFTAVANTTYVIELVDVAATLSAGGRNCNNNFRNGVGVEVYRAGVVTNPDFDPVASSCGMRGSSTIHNFVEFTASTNEDVYIKVIPNDDDVTGSYTVRILPEHTAPAATWDETTAEPNNRPANAFALEPGYAEERTLQIEQASGSFSVTDNVDFDWYRFTAVANRTYVIELVNVAATLSAGGRNCNNNYRNGVGVEVYDAGIVTNSDDKPVASSCGMRGSSTIHNYVEVRPDVAGTYYIRVVPNEDGVNGTYTVRILPEHTDPAATWDNNTAEPNNHPANAFALTPGTSYTFQAEAQDSVFSISSQVDYDWYRFTAEPNQTYTINLTNVSAELVESGRNCNNNYRGGVGLVVHNSDAVVNLDASEVEEKCNALFDGNLHNQVTFESGNNETFYIRVVPNADMVSGSYTLRISSSGDISQVFLPLLQR